MKNRTKRPYLLYLITLPIVAAATVILRTVALLNGYEADIGRYTVSTLPLIVGLLLLGVGAALALLTHELRELFVFRPSYRDLPSLFSGVFAAVVLILFGITLSLDGLDGENRYAAILAVFSGVMAILGAVLFILRAFDGTARGGRFALLNLPLAVLGVSYPLYLSFRNGLRINDPAVIMATVAWILVAFFFLGEARIALERAMWALHTYITVMAVIGSATLAFPNLVYHLVKGEALLGNSEHDFVLLAIFLYTLARLIAVFRTAMNEATDTTRIAMGLAPTETDEKTTDEVQRHEEASDR